MESMELPSGKTINVSHIMMIELPSGKTINASYIVMVEPEEDYLLVTLFGTGLVKIYGDDVDAVTGWLMERSEKERP